MHRRKDDGTPHQLSAEQRRFPAQDDHEACRRPSAETRRGQPANRQPQDYDRRLAEDRRRPAGQPEESGLEPEQQSRTAAGGEGGFTTGERNRKVSWSRGAGASAGADGALSSSRLTSRVRTAPSSRP